MTTYPVGSFILVPAQGWAGMGIALGELLCGQPSRFTHAAVVVAEDGTTVEAAPGGAFVGNVSRYKGRALLISDAPVQGWLRWADSGEGWKRARVVEEARKLVGTPYSAADYLALALLHLHLPSRWVRNRVESSGHLICSALVDRAYANAGIHLYDDGRLPGDVMPSDLAAWAEDHGVTA